MGQTEFTYLQTAFLYAFLPIAQWYLVLFVAGSLFAAAYVIFGGLFRHLSR